MAKKILVDWMSNNMALGYTYDNLKILRNIDIINPSIRNEALGAIVIHRPMIFSAGRYLAQLKFNDNKNAIMVFEDLKGNWDYAKHIASNMENPGLGVRYMEVFKLIQTDLKGKDTFVFAYE